MQPGMWQQFVTWWRNIQRYDQRTAQLLKERCFEISSSHLLFSWSLIPNSASSVSSFPAPFLKSSFSFVLISPIPSHLPCVQSVSLHFFIFIHYSELTITWELSHRLWSHSTAEKAGATLGTAIFSLNKRILNIYVPQLAHTMAQKGTKKETEARASSEDRSNEFYQVK